MRYKDYLYDPEAPEEKAAEPPAFDLGDPLLGERTMLEQAVNPIDPETLAANREQADLVGAIFGALCQGKPPLTELSTSATAFWFVALTIGPPPVPGAEWSGFRSPKLSRLKLSRAKPSEVVGIVGDLWHDRAAWDQPCYGQVLSGPH